MWKSMWKLLLWWTKICNVKNYFFVCANIVDMLNFFHKKFYKTVENTIKTLGDKKLTKKTIKLKRGYISACISSDRNIFALSATWSLICGRCLFQSPNLTKAQWLLDYTIRNGRHCIINKRALPYYTKPTPWQIISFEGNYHNLEFIVTRRGRTRW